MTVQNSVYEKFRNIILSLIDVQETDVAPDKKLRADLGIRSIDLVEILTALENEFDITIGDDDLRSGMTVQDIVDLVHQKTR